MNKLTKNQISILDHTKKRAADRKFFGDSKDMQVLVKLGLMKYLGKVSFCPDKIFTITEEGLTWIK